MYNLHLYKAHSTQKSQSVLQCISPILPMRKPEQERIRGIFLEELRPSVLVFGAEGQFEPTFCDHKINCDHKCDYFHH